MNKKETAALEAALTEAALRRTCKIEPDVFPPPPVVSFGALSTGWIPVGVHSDRPSVDVACTSRVHHAIGRTDETRTQGTRNLYSTKLLALRALRYQVESDCARRLRAVDKQIEDELAKAAE